MSSWFQLSEYFHCNRLFSLSLVCSTVCQYGNICELAPWRWHEMPWQPPPHPHPTNYPTFAGTVQSGQMWITGNWKPSAANVSGKDSKKCFKIFNMTFSEPGEHQHTLNEKYNTAFYIIIPITHLCRTSTDANMQSMKAEMRHSEDISFHLSCIDHMGLCCNVLML